MRDNREAWLRGTYAFLKNTFEKREPDGRILVSHSPREFQIPASKSLTSRYLGQRYRKILKAE